MSGSLARRPDVENLVAAYRADLVAAGMFAGHPVTSVARMFFIYADQLGIDQNRTGTVPSTTPPATPTGPGTTTGWRSPRAPSR